MIEEKLAKRGEGMAWKEKQMKNQGIRTATKQGLMTFNRGTNVENSQRKETIALLWS